MHVHSYLSVVVLSSSPGVWCFFQVGYHCYLASCCTLSAMTAVYLELFPLQFASVPITSPLRPMSVASHSSPLTHLTGYTGLARQAPAVPDLAVTIPQERLRATTCTLKPRLHDELAIVPPSHLVS